MDSKNNTKIKWTLILGDTLALAIVTVIGFASHGETDIAFAPRMFTTYIPLLVSWFLIAPWLGLFNPQMTAQSKTAFAVTFGDAVGLSNDCHPASQYAKFGRFAVIYNCPWRECSTGNVGMAGALYFVWAKQFSNR